VLNLVRIEQGSSLAWTRRLKKEVFSNIRLKMSLGKEGKKR
jgi:hypothetical protein